MSNRSKSHRALATSVPNATQPIDENQALMLDVLGQPPVMFHRAYVGIAGGIAGALWLSFAMGRRAQTAAALQEADQAIVEPLWFSFSREECEEGTGLTRHQQDSARRELRQMGVVLERRRSTTEVAIDTRRLGQLLMAQSRAQWGIAPAADSGLDQTHEATEPPSPSNASSEASAS